MRTSSPSHSDICFAWLSMKYDSHFSLVYCGSFSSAVRPQACLYSYPRTRDDVARVGYPRRVTSHITVVQGFTRFIDSYRLNPHKLFPGTRSDGHGWSMTMFLTAITRVQKVQVPAAADTSTAAPHSHITRALRKRICGRFGGLKIKVR